MFLHKLIPHSWWLPSVTNLQTSCSKLPLTWEEASYKSPLRSPRRKALCFTYIWRGANDWDAAIASIFCTVVIFTTGAKVSSYINTIFMLIAKCNKKWSMKIQGSVWFELHWVNPFPTNRFSPYKTLNNIPCMVFCQCIKLFLHCLLPIGLFHSLRIEIRYGNGKQGCKQVCIRKAIEIRWFRATTWPSTLWQSWIRSGGSSRLRLSSTELQIPLAYKLP